MYETRGVPVWEWPDYLSAAHRKVLVAGFHLERLCEVYTDTGLEEPPVPVQAYFEGAVVSVSAAIDQVSQAVNSARDLHLSSNQLVGRAFETLCGELPEVRQWFEDPLGVDLRTIRVRLVHHVYSKMRGHQGWEVERGKGHYDGSRLLTDYARAAVDYGQGLVNLLPKIKEVLSGTPGNSREAP